MTMSGVQLEDPELEREIDLGRWVDALRSYWWIAAAGLVAGLVVGTLFTLGGSTTYIASAVLARGQVFSPSGNQVVLTYLQSPGALQTYANSPEALKYAANKAGMTPAELIGHVDVSTINSLGKAVQGTNSVLVQVSVTLPKPKRAEDAANAIATYIKGQTTSDYVKHMFQVYKQRLANYSARQASLALRIKNLNAVLAKPAGLTPLDQLVVSTQLDSAQAALGQTLDSETTTQQQLLLVQDVEQTQFLQAAVAQKAPTPSRRKAVVYGGIIGLLIGLVAAFAYGLRANRAAEQ